MSSIFANNRLLPALKRRSRSRSKAELSSPVRAKPLDILPNLSEEDEVRLSVSSTSFASSPYYPTRNVGGSVTLGGRPSKHMSDRKRDSRRVVLTGTEGITFDDFFPFTDEPPRAAPRPPFTKTSTCESPLDDINLRFSGLGIALDFPSPPRASLSSRGHSPTPSVSSSYTASTTASDFSSSSKASPTTPPTSDDESHLTTRLGRAPTCKSHRASILFMKSMPDLRLQQPSAVEDPNPELNELDDAAWFAHDISDMVTLSTPLPSTFPTTPTAASQPPQIRPDSIPPPPPRGIIASRSRQGKLLPSVPYLSIPTGSGCGPSAQLDPTFPARTKLFYIPSRPPPPPPIQVQCSSPTMEEKTDELLALLANAALGTGFLGTGLVTPLNIEESVSTPVTPSSIFAIGTPCTPRPPPRMSVPADIADFFDDAPIIIEDDGSVELEIRSPGPGQDWPSTPHSAAGIPVSPMSSFDFDMETSASQSTLAMPVSPAMPDSPVVGMYTPNVSATPTNERTLHSRWSSSTLSSMIDRQTPLSPSSWMGRFHLGSTSPSKKGKGKAHANAPKATSSPATRKSLEMDSGLERRDSHSSKHSDSGESNSSSGLRRKPIPIEIFMRG